MKRLVKSCVWVAMALLATALVGAAVAEETPNGNLQGSWNDYPAKWIGNSSVPTTTPSADFVTPSVDVPADPQPPAVMIPPATPPVDNPPSIRPPVRPPIQQQQQGKPSGGFDWGGGKTGGGFNWGGGKTGGGFNWGKTRPPQSQQGSIPGGAIPGGGQSNPNQDQLLEYIRQLQLQNAQLRALLQRLAEQQAMNDGRSPGLPSEGVPID